LPCVCWKRAPKTEQGHQSSNVDAQLEEERRKAALDFKVLVLGAGESGKSTVIKQLRNVYLGKNAISRTEIESYTSVLHTNTIQAMKLLIRACETLDIPLAESEEKAQQVLALEDNATLQSENALVIKELWDSEPLQAAFARKSEIYFPDAGPYYFENAYRFTESDFLPSEEDTVMARVRTTGMVMTEFDITPIHWRIVDVGGQRSERKKWIRFFDDVEAILFVVNLAGYNQVLFEDQSKNRMIESLELFEQVANYDCFKNTPIYLFLNKKDLFEQLLRNRDITCLFPDYDGEKTTQAQLDYIAKQFQSRLPEGKDLSSANFIAARMKRDIKYAFDDVRETLLASRKKEIDWALKKAK